MKRIEFTEEQIEQLSYESIHAYHPLVRRRMQALLLKSQGVLHQRIATVLDLNTSTVRTYFDRYLEGGFDALQQVSYAGKPNLLEQRKDEILPALEANPSATLKEAQATLEAVTGLKRSLSQVSAFLKKPSFPSQSEVRASGC